MLVGAEGACGGLKVDVVIPIFGADDVGGGMLPTRVLEVGPFGCTLLLWAVFGAFYA